jgi:hypothetical protein
MLYIAILGHVLYRDVMTKQATTVGDMQSPTPIISEILIGHSACRAQVKYQQNTL